MLLSKKLACAIAVSIFLSQFYPDAEVVRHFLCAISKQMFFLQNSPDTQLVRTAFMDSIFSIKLVSYPLS